MGHIKTHYFTSHTQQLNRYAIVPVGGPAWWELAHDRDTKFPRAAGK
jgi:glutathionyl-hydroquinone reductase